MRYTLIRKQSTTNPALKEFTFGWNNSIVRLLDHAESVDVPETDLLIGDRETGRRMTINEARQEIAK